MRQPQQHPSRQTAAGAGPLLELDLNVELDLELDLGSAPAATPLAPSPPPAAGPQLAQEALQVGSAAAAVAAIPSSSPDDFSMDLDLDDAVESRADDDGPGGDQKEEAPDQAVLAQPKPAARPSMGLNELELRHDELVGLAGYPEGPDGLAACPKYAWGVFWRHRELQQELEAKALAFEQLLHGVRGQFDEIALDVRSRMPEQLASSFAEADGAHAVVRERQEQMQAADTSFSGEDEALSEQLKDISQRRGPLEDVLKAAKIQVEGALDQQRHAALAHKRGAAQLNAAMEAAREAAAEGARFAPPEHAKRIQKLQSVDQAAHRELETRNATLKAAKAALQAARKQIRDNDRAMSNAAGARQNLEKRARKTKDTALGGLHDAQVLRLAAVERALRTIEVEQPGALSPTQLARMTVLDETKGRASEDLDTLREAIATYDEEAIKKGVGMVVAVILTVIVLLVMVASG